MVLNSFSAGVNTSFSNELNNNFNGGKVVEVYTSTGFDASISASSGTSSTAYEMTAIDSSTLATADYLIIQVTAYHTTVTSDSVQKRTSLKFETKEIGGSYGTVFDEVVHRDFNAFERNNLITTTYYHQLTAGEKSNGVQVRITGTAYAQSGSVSVSIANVQTVLKLCH